MHILLKISFCINIIRCIIHLKVKNKAFALTLTILLKRVFLFRVSRCCKVVFVCFCFTYESNLALPNKTRRHYMLLLSQWQHKLFCQMRLLEYKASAIRPDNRKMVRSNE